MTAFPPKVILCLAVSAACLVASAWVIYNAWREARAK